MDTDATSLPYTNLPDPPRDFDAAGVLVRLVDAIGFRYRWATEGLCEDDAALRPSPAQMSLAELLAHVRDLVAWARACVVAAPRPGPPYEVRPPAPLAHLRRQTLDEAFALRAAILGADASRLATLTLGGRRDGAAYPWWHLVNGPLADALTHVGQIAAWRRHAGRPAPTADVFRGRPPRGT